MPRGGGWHQRPKRDVAGTVPASQEIPLPPRPRLTALAAASPLSRQHRHEVAGEVSRWERAEPLERAPHPGVALPYSRAPSVKQVTSENDQDARTVEDGAALLDLEPGLHEERSQPPWAKRCPERVRE